MALQVKANNRSTHNPCYAKPRQEANMAEITLQGNSVRNNWEPAGCRHAGPFLQARQTDLSDAELNDFSGKNIVLNIFASLDTSVCAASVRRFNKEAGESPDTVVLCISADLPHARKRFCEAEGLNDVIPLLSSVLRNSAGTMV